MQQNPDIRQVEQDLLNLAERQALKILALRICQAAGVSFLEIRNDRVIFDSPQHHTLSVLLKNFTPDAITQVCRLSALHDDSYIAAICTFVGTKFAGVQQASEFGFEDLILVVSAVGATLSIPRSEFSQIRLRQSLREQAQRFGQHEPSQKAKAQGAAA